MMKTVLLYLAIRMWFYFGITESLRGSVVDPEFIALTSC